MTNQILQIAFLLLVPILLHNALKDKNIAKWLSPVVVCYILGIFAGTFTPHLIHLPLSEEIRDVSIILAIPLLLITSNFVEWLPKAKSVLWAFVLSVISVLIGTLLAFGLFKDQTEHAWMISGMVFAGFTGTSPNLNAVGRGLDCPEDILLLVNMGDIISSGIYLIILTSIAHPILSRFLPAYQPYEHEEDKTEIVTENEDDPEITDVWSYLSYYQMKRFGIYIAPLLISIAIVALTVLAEPFIFPAEGLHGTFVILSVTILGITASFIPGFRELKSAYRIGQYLLLVFCIALGSLINAETILSASPLILTYVSLILVVMITLNLIFAKLFKIDADTTIITSTSCIFGPAFIGQVAMAMKNKEIIFSGMIVSMVGIALGNFLGIGLAYILKGFM